MNSLAIYIIKFYRKYISGLFGSNKCKYYPTCSQYALEAFSRYGFFKATIKSIWRILRCNPFSKGGYDPLD